MMQNLDQIRACNAYNSTRGETFSGKAGGEVAKKIPALIIEHGLLATLAFALENNSKGKGVNSGHEAVLDTVAQHLSSKGIERLPAGIRTAEKWFEFLVKTANSQQLREQTDEAMNYLSYFRRFATKSGQGG
ncbi:MAG: type III-B CRISPR module-associated protein Cmr5 [Kiritimatiellia bacterium]